MTEPKTHVLTLPGAMLKRGFWLYVWEISTPLGDMLYVGRTGDNSSPNASAPYTRMGQHLGAMKNQNALRQHLTKRTIDPTDCTYKLIAHGPVFDEVPRAEGAQRADLMTSHLPLRNEIGALEKALADALCEAGYDVLNKVSWKHGVSRSQWEKAREAFAEHFPKLL